MQRTEAPTYVPDSLPYGEDARETLEVHPEELALQAQEFANRPDIQVPESDLAPFLK